MERHQQMMNLKKKVGKHTERRERADGLGWSETYTPVFENVTALVGLEIDVEALFNLLGGRAVQTKRGRSTALGGIIRCQVKTGGRNA